MSSHISSQPLPNGTILKDYRILKPLSIGHFGISYLAIRHGEESSPEQHTFIIQECFPAQSAGRAINGLNVIARQNRALFDFSLYHFFKQAQLQSRLHHAGIQPQVTYFTAHDTTYTVVPGCKGSPLSELPVPATAEQAAGLEKLLPPLLDALDYLHGLEIAHRDIKPVNILVTHGKPMLRDFSIAVQMDDKEAGCKAGTPGYCPIEQSNAGCKLSPAADLYALGATLYRCITGATPASSLERQAALSESRPDPLLPLAGNEQYRKLYSAEFLTSVDRALKLYAQDRFATAHDWLKALPAPPTEAPTPLTAAPAVEPWVSPESKPAAPEAESTKPAIEIIPPNPDTTTEEKPASSPAKPAVEIIPETTSEKEEPQPAPVKPAVEIIPDTPKEAPAAQTEQKPAPVKPAVEIIPDTLREAPAAQTEQKPAPVKPAVEIIPDTPREEPTAQPEQKPAPIKPVVEIILDAPREAPAAQTEQKPAPVKPAVEIIPDTPREEHAAQTEQKPAPVKPAVEVIPETPEKEEKTAHQPRHEIPETPADFPEPASEEKPAPSPKRKKKSRKKSAVRTLEPELLPMDEDIRLTDDDEEKKPGGCLGRLFLLLLLLLGLITAASLYYLQTPDALRNHIEQARQFVTEQLSRAGIIPAENTDDILPAEENSQNIPTVTPSTPAETPTQPTPQDSAIYPEEDAKDSVTDAAMLGADFPGMEGDDSSALPEIKLATPGEDFYRAAADGHTDVLQEITRTPTDLDVPATTGEQAGMTALMIAAAHDRDAALAYLISAGANVNSSQDNGWQAIHHAAQSGAVNALRVLLTSGADADARNEDGMTALMMAAAQGNEQLVLLLLNHGANRSLLNKQNRSALDLAREQGHQNIVNMFDSQTIGTIRRRR